MVTKEQLEMHIRPAPKAGQRIDRTCQCPLVYLNKKAQKTSGGTKVVNGAQGRDHYPQG